MLVTILYFARSRELTNTHEEELTVDEGRSAYVILLWLPQRRSTTELICLMLIRDDSCGALGPTVRPSCRLIRDIQQMSPGLEPRLH